MVKKTTIVDAARTISEALRTFLSEDESNNVHVFQSSAGNLRAMIGSDRFKGKGPVERQQIIWKYLKERVPTEQLVYCSGIHPMDAAEYELEMFGRSSSASVDLFIKGATPTSEDDDE